MKHLKTYGQLLEKSILTRFGIPEPLMKTLQKSYQIKYSEPEKVKLTKKNLKELLESKHLIINVNNDDTYSVLLFYRGRNELKCQYTLYNKDGNDIDGKSGNMTNIIKDFDTKNIKETYSFSENQYSGYRHPRVIERDRIAKIEKKKLEDFRDYFNNNIANIINRYYEGRWSELVNAIQTHYLEITKDIHTFVNRNNVKGKPGYYNGDYNKKTADFTDIGYVLQDFADKIDNDSTFKIKSEYGYIISEPSCRSLSTFIKTLEDFKDKSYSSNMDFTSDQMLILKAIDKYGIMKLSTLYARFVMNTMLDWMEQKINKYTGLEDSLNKYNL